MKNLASAALFLCLLFTLFLCLLFTAAALAHAVCGSTPFPDEGQAAPAPAADSLQWQPDFVGRWASDGKRTLGLVADRKFKAQPLTYLCFYDDTAKMPLVCLSLNEDNTVTIQKRKPGSKSAVTMTTIPAAKLMDALEIMLGNEASSPMPMPPAPTVPSKPDLSPTKPIQPINTVPAPTKPVKAMTSSQKVEAIIQETRRRDREAERRAVEGLERPSDPIRLRDHFESIIRKEQAEEDELRRRDPGEWGRLYGPVGGGG